MNKITIQTLIDKVIGKKGLIRVPSWWMRKVLMQMADWVQEGDDANEEKTVKVKEEADVKINALGSNIDYLRNLSLPYILVSGTGVVNINRSDINFSDADNKLISITGPISFGRSNLTDNKQLKSIVIRNLDFRLQSKSMEGMFRRCASLTSLVLTELYTYAVTNMSYMFSNCSSLTSLDLSSFDTSSVLNMEGMFGYCSNLVSLDLSGFDTSKVTNMRNIFCSCSNLTTLNLSKFNTSSVTNMEFMFELCKKLTFLNLSMLNTSSVTSMFGMFSNCSGLTHLDLSSFDTSSVTNMNSMFNYCSSLTSLDLSSFDTSSVISMDSIFFYCSELTSLILGPNFFKTPAVTSIDFSYCSKWTNDTVVTSLVTNSYDRKTAGLSKMTLKLHANTKAALTDEQKATITAKGYTIA